MYQNVVGYINSVCNYNFVKFVVYSLALPEKFNYIKTQGIVPIISFNWYFHREFCSDNDLSLGLIIYIFYTENIEIGSEFIDQNTIINTIDTEIEFPHENEAFRGSIYY